MAISTISPEDVLLNTIYSFWSVVDVRSPSEFAKGHLPNAHNIPLFSDEERKTVGTLYKKMGRAEAIKSGLKITGPKLERFVIIADKLLPDRKMIIYCWRGGMRSSSMSWLFNLAGYKVLQVSGGYKALRKEIHKYFLRDFKFIILSGYTGTGKTEILHHLEQSGAQVLDLETLAHHKGSAFGSLGMPEQPSQEQFENAIFEKIKTFDITKLIWVEDESRMIGRCCIPTPLYDSFQEAPLIFVSISSIQRVKRLVEEYARFDKQDLASAILKISKKVGPQNAKAALDALEAQNFESVATIILKYYDKCYNYDMQKRNSKITLELMADHFNDNETTRELLKLENRLYSSGKSANANIQ